MTMNNMRAYDQHMLVSRTMTTNTMAISCHNVFFIILFLVQSHERSVNLGETCKCGVASVAGDAATAAAAAADIIVTDF